MNTKQLNRYRTINYQRFYLLNIIDKTKNYTLNISGSSGNVYNIEVSKENKTICCNCPDMKTWAKTYNCICKHCCFVIFKVCDKSISLDSDFFENLIFNDTDFNSIATKLEEKSILFNEHKYFETSDIIKPELIEKFHSLTIAESINPFETKKKGIDTLCSICCDTINDDEEIVECPDCHNVFHKNCKEQWISFGNITCALCRSTSWSKYKVNSYEDNYEEYLNIGY